MLTLVHPLSSDSFPFCKIIPNNPTLQKIKFMDEKEFQTIVRNQLWKIIMDIAISSMGKT